MQQQHLQEEDSFNELMADVGNESDISESTLSQLYGYNSSTLTLLRHLPAGLQNFRPELSASARQPIDEVRMAVCLCVCVSVSLYRCGCVRV